MGMRLCNECMCMYMSSVLLPDTFHRWWVWEYNECQTTGLYIPACVTYFIQHSLDYCQIEMVDSQFNYTYEYQGNAPKLVHTPLTDKCYLTLTQAMLMGLGGNPYGPAGTGKTESVKALGGLMGRQVLVFNCDEVSYVIFKSILLKLHHK